MLYGTILTKKSKAYFKDIKCRVFENKLRKKKIEYNISGKFNCNQKIFRIFSKDYNTIIFLRIEAFNSLQLNFEIR